MKTATRRRPAPKTTKPTSIWPITVAPGVRAWGPDKMLTLLENGTVHNGMPGLEGPPRPEQLAIIRQGVADMRKLAESLMAEAAAVEAKFLPAELV